MANTDVSRHTQAALTAWLVPCTAGALLYLLALKLTYKYNARPPIETGKIIMSMSYEEYLDEVTTLMTENFDLSDEAAIKYVMRAQANDFFTLHDDMPAMRTLERAVQDAQTIYDQRHASRPHVPPKRSNKVRSK